uniref:Uncharacterized protein n=1 Tax=Cajanus cajan TaxID=3821 RepID=A0A151REU7_CAJCA|nr:hypothetical protein KK1_037642 [Cajanus cajan]
MNDFATWMDFCQLLNITCTDSPYTRTNNIIESARTDKRLDRFMCNGLFLSLWKQVFGHVLPKLKSDHHPILLSSINPSDTHAYSFKFLSMWLHHLDCRHIVSSAWNIPVLCNLMHILTQKLKIVKSLFKVWNKNIFENIHEKVNSATSFLINIQSLISSYGYSDFLIKKKKKKKKTASHE